MSSKRHSHPRNARSSFAARLPRVALCGLAATTMLQASALAAPPDDAAQFKPVPGSIVAGLSGLVTGTKDTLTVDRAKERINFVRAQLTDRLLEAKDVETKLSLGGFAPDSNDSDYRLSNRTVLCIPRGTHAVAAAATTYIGAVTDALNRFATPPKIETIGDAFGTLFRNYSIEVPQGKASEVAGAVIGRCNDDTVVWATASYGRALAKQPQMAQDILGIGDTVTAVTALYNAIANILRPILVAGAKAIDANARADAINKFLTDPKNRDPLIDAARTLAEKGRKFAQKSRRDAVAQFAEKMAALRSIQIDLSKVDSCKGMIKAPVLALPPGANGGLDRVPTDDFVVCYAAAWKQVADATQDMVTTANQYDAFADASDDKLPDAVDAIKKSLATLNNPPDPKFTDFWNAATQLIAFGQTVDQALSKDNIDKANKAIADVMKLFSGKP